MDILPLKDYENIRAKKRIIKNSVKLEAYNNQSIPCVGMTRLTLTLKHKTYKVMFAVVDTDNMDSGRLSWTSPVPDYVRDRWRSSVHR